MYVFDFAILIGQMLFTPRQTCLYGILLVLVYTITLDKLLAVGAFFVREESLSCCLLTASAEEFSRTLIFFIVLRTKRSLHPRYSSAVFFAMRFPGFIRSNLCAKYEHFSLCCGLHWNFCTSTVAIIILS